MPALMTMVAWDGDSIGRSAGNARLSNDVAELRRVSHAIERGNQAFSGWALAAGGSVIETGGDEGLIEIPAEALDQLEALRLNYKDLVGATVSVGVGKSPAEASQALLVAKARGKNRVVFFAPEIPKEIEKLQDQTPEDKLRSEYLGKAAPNVDWLGAYQAELGDKCAWCGKEFEPGQTVVGTGHATSQWCDAGHALKGYHPSNPFELFLNRAKTSGLVKADDEGSADKKSSRGVSPPSRQRGESSEGQVAQGALQDQAAAAAPLASSLPGGPALAGFHAAAAGQDQQDRAAAVRRSSDMQELKQRLAATLQQLKTQLPVLQQIKQTFPDTYQAVTALARGVVDLARGLQDQDAQLAKAERGHRVWREKTGGFPGGISIPGAGHPQREAYDAAYRSAAAARYARGDVAGLGDVQDIDLSQITPGNSGKGVVNQSRYDLYHRMAKAGEKMPPAIARRTASGFELLDGTHRYEASKAAGGAKLPAYIVKSWGEGSMADVQPHEPMLAQGTDLMREAMNEVEFDASSKWPPGMGMAASEMGETEAEPDEKFPEGKELDKEAAPSDKPPRIDLPVGTLHNGKLKVGHGPGSGGKSGWKGVRAGLIQAVSDPGGVGGGGANTHAVSSREPNSP